MTKRDSQLFPGELPHVRPIRSRSRWNWRQYFSLHFLIILLLSGFIGGWSAASFVLPANAATTNRPGFTLQQFLQQGHPYNAFDGLHVLPQRNYTARFWNKLSQGSAKPSFPPSAEPATIKAVSQPLTAAATSTALHLIASDTQGTRLEVLVPAGAFDFSKATNAKGTAPQGTLTLTLTQLRGHFSAATSDLGEFQFQITDGQGQPIQGVQLHSPMTLIYHYRAKELSNLSLNPAHLYLIWPDLVSTAAAAKQSFAWYVVLMQNDAKAGTLTAQTTTLSGTPFVLGSGSNPIQNPPKPNFASVQGSGGQLSYSYPLVVPPGPPGTAPNLAVVYSSAATNGRKTPTTPANNVGEGWALTLGAISAEQYPDGTIWYSISGVDNVNDRLIPDTTGNNFATEHISYLQIAKITSSSTNQPCFRVIDTSSNYYEFGCTSDSLQYYIDSSGNRVNYEFDLDKLVPANEGPGTNGRNLTASYVQDMETSGGHTWVRDSALKQITYGNGTYRIGTLDFFYNGPSNYTDPNSHIQYVTQYTSTYETNCHLPAQSPQPQRCDDPIDRSGGMVDPDVMSTLSLQTVKVYTGDDSSNTHLDYSYSFTYQDTAFGNCPTADTTLSSAYCAGNHLLTSITPTVYQNGTGHALPGVTFGYSGGRPNKYDDSSQNYHMENNWQYLTSYHDHSTGVGASSITYHTAYNNSHGTPYTNGDNRYDPLYCVWNPSNCQSGTSFYPMDDKMWTEQVVTQITDVGKDSSASNLSPATISYNYWLTKTQGSCPADSMNDSDCVGFGWIPNSGLDWQDYYHGEFRGFGSVLITSPSGDLTVQNYAATYGWDSPASDPRNYLAGQMLEEDVYAGGQVNASKLLRATTYFYGGQQANGQQSPTAAACASTSTYPSTMYRPCEVVLLNRRTTSYEQLGSPNNNAPWVESDYTYDDYSTSSGLGDYHQSPATASYHNVKQEVITGSNIPTLTKHWTYYTSNSSSSIYYYYQAHTVAHSDIVDSQGHMWACQDTTYDQGVGNGVPQPAAGWPTTVVSYSDCSNQSTTAIKTYNGYDNYGDLVASVDGVAAANPSLYSSAGCTLSTAPTIFPTSSWSSSHYTVCHKYDPVSSLTTDTWNVLGQHTSTAYDATQGQLPISSTDVNGQVTTMSYSYDSSGNKTVQVKLPNETGSYTNQSTLTSTCSDSSTYPCLEIDTNSSLYSGAVTRTFYDSQGRAVETLTPGPDGSHTIVTFTVYYDQTHSVFTSFPFVVNSRTTWLDPNGATDDTGTTPYGTAKYLDPLGRVISTNDAYSYQTHTSYSLGSANGDSQTYVTATFVDANNHVQVTFSDALGRTRYVQTYSGTSGGTLTPNMQISTQYNALDKPTLIVVTDLVPQSGQTITSVTTTIGYDDMGRMTSLNDPDRGLHTYGYDADGRVLVDVSGSRTLGVSYDLLGRPGCIQDANPTTDGSGSCSSGSHPLVQNTYDTSKLGTQGTTDFPVGQLTQSVATTYYDTTYTNKSTVTEQFQHDQRGQLVSATLQIAVPSGWGLTTSLPLYQETTSYNDAGQPTMLKTTVGGATGYTVGEVYDSTTGTLTGLNTTGSGSANLATLAYNPQDQISDINFQTTSGTPLADDNFTYDKDLRPAGSTASWQSGSGSSGTLFSTSRAYDPVGNVISVSTTHAAVPGQTGSGGSETQNFCYDEQNRLVWAGNSGTQPGAGNGTCGSGTLSNSLSGASYSSSFVYTHLGQLWQGPLNGGSTQEQYLYCNTNKPHQLVGLYPVSSGATCSNYTSKTADYATSYDGWGNASSRNTGGSSASLTFDALDHLVECFAGSSSQAWYAYDASGTRVLSRNITSSGTSLTTSAFGVEEHTYSATGTNTGNTYYYSLGGHLIGELTGTSTLLTQFFLTDALGSVLASFSDTPNSATVLGNQVYGPYGNQRYLKGAMGTAKGYTGQYADPTGLDYYNARYYDPVAGVFLSADSKQGNAQGMNPYAYVAGNPETLNDPSGQYVAGPGGITYIPGAPYYMEGGEAYQVSTPSHPVPDRTPYTGPGIVNGWRPGQGPNAVTHPAYSPSKNPSPSGSCANHSTGSGCSTSGGKGSSGDEGCGPACVAHDEDLIRHYYQQQQAAKNINGDITRLIVDLVTAFIDGSAGNAVALGLDILGGVLPHIARLIYDVELATGHSAPAALVQFQTLLQGVAGVVQFLKGYFFFLLGFSQLVSPVLNVAKGIAVKWLSSGFLSMVNAYQGVNNLGDTNPDTLFQGKTPDQIHALCIYDGLKGC